MLEIKSLYKSFGHLEVLSDVSVNFEAGKVSCIIGPSGSGKSTLLRCMNHLEAPDRGTITWNGELIGYERRSETHLVEKSDRALRGDRRRIGMVFQHFNLFQNMTAVENVTLGLRQVEKLSRSESEARAKEALSEVGLLDKADSYPRKLSGGQQQRVGIARALAMKPEVLLFDEPTSALDPELVGDVLAVMTRIAEEGMTMIVVTHELGFAREVGDSLIFMNDGQVIEQGNPEEMINNPVTDRLRTFVSRVRK